MLNATSSQPLQGYTVTFYMVKADGSNGTIGTAVTNSSGVAKLYWLYPALSLGPRAFSVKVAAGQQIICSPLIFTVARETTLRLNVNREESGNNHTVSGQLLSYDEPLLLKQIKISVNDTVKAVLNTNDVDGSFSLTLNLQPASNRPTVYRITASFDGDEPSNATAYAYTPNGTRYAVCTTIQFGYKPSNNMTTLTVEPQATHTDTPTKTPEQLQKEAEQSGWLTFWHEFSWWYPWYRLHFVGKYNGQTMIDVGIAPLPFADTGYFPDTPLKTKTDGWFTKVLWSVIQGVVATEIAIWAGSHLGPIYFLAVIGVYIGYKLLNLHLNWNSLENLYISLVSTFTSLAISVWTGLCSFLPANLRALAASAESIKNLAFAFLCKIIMIPINIFLLMMTWNQIVALGGV